MPSFKTLLRTFAPAACGLALVLVAAGCRDRSVAVRDFSPPAAPQGLYSVTGDGSVTLHWVKNTEPDLAGYRVYRSASYNGQYNPLGLTSNTSFVDNGVTNGTTYFYAVAAYDQAGNESDLSVENDNDTPRPAGTNLTLAAASTNPGSAGYDFSARVITASTDTAADVFYNVAGGTRLMVTRDTQTDIQDAGYTNSLDQLDFSPTTGWSPTGTAELILGHAYYVFTRDNHFAKFRVTALTATAVTFDWA